MRSLGDRQRYYFGTTLYALATTSYIVGGAFAFMFILELLKAREILIFKSDLFYAFRGAGEVIILAVVFLVLGKLINALSRRVYPDLHKNLWRAGG